MLYRGLHLSRWWQQRQPCGAAVISVEIHCILHTWDAEFAHHSLGSIRNPFLLDTGELVVAFLPRRVDFIASCRRWTCECQNRAHCACVEGVFQFVSGAN